MSENSEFLLGKLSGRADSMEKRIEKIEYAVGNINEKQSESLAQQRMIIDLLESFKADHSDLKARVDTHERDLIQLTPASGVDSSKCSTCSVAVLEKKPGEEETGVFSKKNHRAILNKVYVTIGVAFLIWALNEVGHAYFTRDDDQSGAIEQGGGKKK